MLLSDFSYISTYRWNFTDTQFHITTLQRVIHIMHYSPALLHIPALAVYTLDEEVHRWISDDPHNRDTCAELITLLLILPTLMEG